MPLQSCKDLRKDSPNLRKLASKDPVGGWTGGSPAASGFGSIIMRLLLIISLLGLWLIVHPEQSYAHTCMEPGRPAEELKEADAVFMGRAVSVSYVEKTFGGQTYVDSLITKFKVVTVWKGPINQTVFISSGGSYGTGFSEGEEYVVYAYNSGRRTGLTTGLCTRTTSLSGAMEDLAGLGEGKTPSQAAATATAQSASGPTLQATDTHLPQPTSASTPRSTGAPAPRATDSPASRPTASPSPKLTESGGGCSPSPNTFDLPVVGLLAGLTWFGLRKRRSESG